MKSIQALPESRKRALGLGFFALVGLLAVTWFRGAYLIKGGDGFMPLAPQLYLQRNAQVWSIQNLGSSSGLNIVNYLFGLQLKLMRFLGLGVVGSEKVLFYAFFTMGGIGMYLLFLELSESGKRYLGAVTAGLFYMMNAYSLSETWGHQTGALFTYGLLPFILFLFVRGIKSRNHLKSILIIIGMWFLVPMAMTNPGFWLPLWGAQGAFAAYYLWINRKDRETVRRSAIFSISVAGSWVLACLWWIVPLASVLTDAYQGIKASGKPEDIYSWTSKSSVMQNSVRLLGDWTIYKKYAGDPYYSWAPFYTSFPFVLLSWVPPVLAFGAYAFKRSRKYVPFFAGLALVVLFLVKGPQAPFGFINAWLFKYMPYAGAFRSTYEKLGSLIALAYAFLIGVSVTSIFDALKVWASSRKGSLQSILPAAAVGLILIILFGALAFPFWTGEIIWNGGDFRPSMRVQIPGYYDQMRAWFERQEGDFRVLSLPPQVVERSSAYKWEHGYFGSDSIDGAYTGEKAIVSSGMQSWNSDDMNRKALSELVGQESDVAARLFSLMGIRYIIVHNDFDYDYVSQGKVNGHPELLPAKLEEALNKPEFKRVKRFGKLDIYEIRPDLVLPHVYAAKSTNIYINELEAWNTALRGVGSIKNKAFYFLDDKEARNFVKVDPSGNANLKISYERVTSFLYRVKVRNAGAPFSLVFSESIHPGWKLYDGSPSWLDTIFGQPLSESRHIRANQYANSWYMDKTGDYEMTVYFWPQNYVYIGAIASGVFLAILAGLAALLWRRSWKR